MAQQAAAQEAAAQANGASPSEGYSAPQNDNKILKLATFAIVLRHLPFEKRQGLLEKFSPEEANTLRDYANMEDLENKLDPTLVAKCLTEIKSSLPQPKKLNKNKVYKRLYNIVKNSNISKVSNMMNKERQNVKMFVTEAAQGSVSCDLPPRIADIVCNYIEEKFNR